MATTKVGIAPMKVAQISKPGGDFEIVERAIPNPGAGEVRIKVQACGVCHSDVFVKEGLWPGIQYPRVPGHEATGVIDEIGAGVTGWKIGQRVGVGWHGGQNNTCLECRRGHFLYCRNPKVYGISYDGEDTHYMFCRFDCIDGLATKWKFIVVGISSDPIAVTPLQLISGERAIQGSAVGTPTDSEDTLRFAELSGVRPMIETYPLERAQEAFARMMSGDAQFRVVLTM